MAVSLLTGAKKKTKNHPTNNKPDLFFVQHPVPLWAQHNASRNWFKIVFMQLQMLCVARTVQIMLYHDPLLAGISDRLHSTHTAIHSHCEGKCSRHKNRGNSPWNENVNNSVIAIAWHPQFFTYVSSVMSARIIIQLSNIDWQTFIRNFFFSVFIISIERRESLFSIAFRVKKYSFVVQDAAKNSLRPWAANCENINEIEMRCLSENRAIGYSLTLVFHQRLENGIVFYVWFWNMFVNRTMCVCSVHTCSTQTHQCQWQWQTESTASTTIYISFLSAVYFLHRIRPHGQSCCDLIAFVDFFLIKKQKKKKTWRWTKSKETSRLDGVHDPRRSMCAFIVNKIYTYI